jgi:hypothetical protein
MSPRTSSYSRAVDEYIAGAAPFAQPILMHLRALMHKTLPDVEEAIKWSHPFFLYHGLILANMAAFKQHCSLGMWGREVAATLRDDGVYNREAMGVLGKLTSRADLPNDRELVRYIRAVANAIDDGTRTKNYSRTKSKPKPAPEIPAALAAAASASTASGLPRLNGMRRATNAWRRRWSGLPRASAATGSMRAAETIRGRA